MIDEKLLSDSYCHAGTFDVLQFIMEIYIRQFDFVCILITKLI